MICVLCTLSSAHSLSTSSFTRPSWRGSPETTMNFLSLSSKIRCWRKLNLTVTDRQVLRRSSRFALLHISLYTCTCMHSACTHRILCIIMYSTYLNVSVYILLLTAYMRVFCNSSLIPPPLMSTTPLLPHSSLTCPPLPTHMSTTPLLHHSSLTCPPLPCSTTPHSHIHHSLAPPLLIYMSTTPHSHTPYCPLPPHLLAALGDHFQSGYTSVL